MVQNMNIEWRRDPCYIEYAVDQNNLQEFKTIISIQTEDFEKMIKKWEVEMYFCLDKSGSMYKEMAMVKESIEWLYKECVTWEISNNYYMIPVTSKFVNKFVLSEENIQELRDMQAGGNQDYRFPFIELINSTQEVKDKDIYILFFADGDTGSENEIIALIK